MKDINNESLKAKELNDDELSQVTGAGSDAWMDICCNPDMGGCGTLDKVRMSAQRWKCQCCGKEWDLCG